MSNNSHLITETYPIFHNSINSNSTNIELRLHNSDNVEVGQRSNSKTDSDGNECFICSTEIAREVQVPIKFLTTRSHAPLIVLMTDILGYKFEDVELHSEYVCKTCYKLVNLIDELQQTLTESKTEVRAKFLDTLQKFKLKYPRTEKIMKQRCSHSSLSCIAKKKETAVIMENNMDRSDISSLIDVPGSTNDASDKANKTVSLNDNNSIETESENERKDIPLYDSDPAFYVNEERLKIGVHRSHNDKYSCLYCKEIFECNNAIRLHVRGYHLPSFLYEKRDYGLHIKNKKPRIGMHLHNVTMRQNGKCEHPYSCLHCDCSYKLLSTLLLHYKENHSPIKPYKCHYCSQSFRKAIQRTRHQVYHCQKSAKP